MEECDTSVRNSHSRLLGETEEQAGIGLGWAGKCARDTLWHMETDPAFSSCFLGILLPPKLLEDGDPQYFLRTCIPEGQTWTGVAPPRDCPPGRLCLASGSSSTPSLSPSEEATVLCRWYLTIYKACFLVTFSPEAPNHSRM